MGIIIKFTEVPIGTCFIHGRQEKKRIAEQKTMVVKDSGKRITRKMKGNPEVEQKICSLRYLGVGLNNVPDELIQMGDGNILERRKNRH